MVEVKQESQIIEELLPLTGPQWQSLVKDGLRKEKAYIVNMTLFKHEGPKASGES